MTAKQIVDLLHPASLELAALRQQAEQLAALGRHTAATACDAKITALEGRMRQEVSYFVHVGGWAPGRQRTYTVALRLLGIAP
jgi:hypothetical protein